MTAKTDSRLIKSAAVTGCRYFCAAICKVKAMALEPMPQNIQKGNAAATGSFCHDSPKSKDEIAARIVTTVN